MHVTLPSLLVDSPVGVRMGGRDMSPTGFSAPFPVLNAKVVALESQSPSLDSRWRF